MFFTCKQHVDNEGRGRRSHDKWNPVWRSVATDRKQTIYHFSEDTVSPTHLPNREDVKWQAPWRECLAQGTLGCVYDRRSQARIPSPPFRPICHFLCRAGTIRLPLFYQTGYHGNCGGIRCLLHHVLKQTRQLTDKASDIVGHGTVSKIYRSRGKSVIDRPITLSILRT